MDLSLRLRICSSDDKNYGDLLFKLVRVEEKVRYRKKALEVDKITSVLTESETYPKHYEKTPYIFGTGLSFLFVRSKIVVDIFISAYGNLKDEFGESSALENCEGKNIRLNHRYVQFLCQHLS